MACGGPKVHVVREYHASVSRIDLNVTQISCKKTWKLSPPTPQLQIAIWQQALLQLDFCDKDFYFGSILELGGARS